MGLLDADLPTLFYEHLKLQQHILILSTMDTDSVCCCKILQSLFKVDNIQYTIIPVLKKEDLLKAYNDHSEQIKTILLINCGGSINIVEYLDPVENVQFFILDSHRPLELDNIYASEQVQVVVHEKEDFDIPQFNEIYQPDMDLQSDDEVDDQYFSDEESEQPSSKRQRREESFEQRKKKHLWQKKRQELMYRYNEFSYFGPPVAYLMFTLAHKLSKECNEIVWWAIIGLTEQYLLERIDSESYVTHRNELQPHVVRLNRTDDDTISVNNMKIVFEHELKLFLYRHWNLFDSFCHSDYISSRFKTWTLKGQKRLLEFFADIGLPLSEAKQKFVAMDVHIKDDVKKWIINSSGKYGLDDVSFGSFVAQIGYRHTLSASDFVLCLSAVLEHGMKDLSGFFSALDILSLDNVDKVLSGIDLAKEQLAGVVNEVRTLTDSHNVVCAGPFIYACVEEASPNSKWFRSPLGLSRLAIYLRGTWTATNKKARSLPFMVCSPVDTDSNMCIALGIPALSDHSNKNGFHDGFNTAARRLKANVQFSYFDSAVVEIEVEQRGKFFDALSALSL